MRTEIEQIIKSFARIIAADIYPAIPMGNYELKFTVGSVDGEYTEKINALAITMGEAVLIDSLTMGRPIALAQAAMRLAASKQLRDKISDLDADGYYESDGHYETGNAKEKNREAFRAVFPTATDFRAFAHEVMV